MYITLVLKKQPVREDPDYIDRPFGYIHNAKLDPDEYFMNVVHFLDAVICRYGEHEDVLNVSLDVYPIVDRKVVIEAIEYDLAFWLGENINWNLHAKDAKIKLAMCIEEWYALNFRSRIDSNGKIVPAPLPPPEKVLTDPTEIRATLLEVDE